MLTTIFKWFVLSSKNPEKISLTLKGLIPFLLIALSYTKFASVIDATTLDTAIKQVVDLVMLLGQIIAAIIAIIGFARKLYNSIRSV